MTRMRTGLLTVVVLWWALPTPLVYAQRGMGDSTGVARQEILPELVSLSGRLASVETHPCQKTTGRGVVGTHLKLETDEGEQVNVDLGWAAAVEPIVRQLSVGQEVKVVAFRTDKMPEKQYVAKSLTFGGKTMQLRDENLRPIWAGGRPAWYASKRRSGYEAGRGRGPGRGWAHQRRWAYERGWGRGRRGGPGRGAGWGWRCPRGRTRSWARPPISKSNSESKGTLEK